MADVTKDDAAPVDPQGGLMKPVANPLFDGDVASLVVTRDVHVHQLLSEIDAKLADPAKYQVIMKVRDHLGAVSEANPLTLHIHPASTDLALVQSVVDAHVPNHDHGKTEQQKEIDALKARLREGDLALPDLNKIFRSILGS
jgi:hypothetical protein